MKKLLQQLWPFSMWSFFVEQLMVLRKNLEISSTEDARRARIAKEAYIRDLLLQEKYADPRHLARFEYKIFSQSGEDGVIREILRRVGETSRFFLEIGVGDNLENNTSYLLPQGWKGLWLDCLPSKQIMHAEGLAPYMQSRQLNYLSAQITAANIRELLWDHLPVEGVDLFSLDIDRSTFSVWSAMDFFQPRVMILEYNAFYQPPICWVMPEGRDPMDSSTMSFGASLASIYQLATQRGYELVHCSLSGVNAFFVRKDLLNAQFFLPPDPLTFYEPYRSFLLYDHELRRSL